ncbi:hypothetical protein JTB14_010076 [Gonioctena quinquepunctata]|nr:hypothetical protein JTB14_010076 [Gonioctena quinquepunctata]
MSISNWETTVPLKHLAPNGEGVTQLEPQPNSNNEANTNKDQSKGISEEEESGTGNPKLSADEDSLASEEWISSNPSSESPSTSQYNNCNRSTRQRCFPERFEEYDINY